MGIVLTVGFGAGASHANAGQLFPPANVEECTGSEVALIWNKTDGTVTCKTMQELFQQHINAAQQEPEDVQFAVEETPPTGGNYFRPEQPEGPVTFTR